MRTKLTTLFGLGLALCASAQDYSPQSFGATNSLAASATISNAFPTKIDVRMYRNVSLLATFQGAAASSNLVTIPFTAYWDRYGTNRHTSTNYWLTGYANGTNLVVLSSNVAVPDVSYLVPTWFKNDNTNALTNFVVYAIPKGYTRDR